MQVLDGDYETGSFLLVRKREREREEQREGENVKQELYIDMMFGDTAYSIISVQKWDTSGYGLEGIKTKRERDTMLFYFYFFYRKDIEEVYPLSVITSRARSHQDQLVSGDLHETYYQVIIG